MIFLQRLVLALIFSSANASGFPEISEVQGTSASLSSYKPYLRFVTKVGMSSNQKLANHLLSVFQNLERVDREAAARFLRNLRSEMELWAALSSRSTRDLTESDPAVQAWVKQYLADWSREAEEALFRSKALKITKANLAYSEKHPSEK